MHSNLEKRLIRLLSSKMAYEMAMTAAKDRYSMLFESLAEDVGGQKKLAAMVGFAPLPEGGNAITRGEAEPSNEDVLNLMAVWERMQK